MNQTQAELVPAGDIRLVLFKGRGIRQVFHNDEWFFSAIDVIKVLSGRLLDSMKAFNLMKAKKIEAGRKGGLSKAKAMLEQKSSNARAML